MRNIYCLALVAALAACSSAASATPTPAPTPAPALKHCIGVITDTNGHRAQLGIGYATGLAAAAASSHGAISLTPNEISLTPEHPRATIAILESDYVGAFDVQFVNCNGYLNARFVTRTTLQVSR